MSLIGQEYKQPRVFAHDAHPVVIGAINSTWNINTKFPGIMNFGGIQVTSGGTGYAVDMVLTMTGGTGTGAIVTVTAVSGGVITDYTVSMVGSAYVVGDNLTQSGASAPAGGTGFTCTVTNIDIPNTQEAGCCLYFSPAAAAAANITVIMESGEYDNSAGDGYPASAVKTFTLVPAGIFMPILVKQVTSATVTNDILALY
jgi:hypothetical protein